MSKQTAVDLIFEKFNLLSDADFKSWMLNNHDELKHLERLQIEETYNQACLDAFRDDNKYGRDYYNETYAENKNGITMETRFTPLTDEWLLKLRFCQNESADIPTYFKNFGSFLDDDYEYCFMIYKDIDENFYTQIFGKKIILTNVHQLQNLFFAIVGEELETKN
jgi:hypothetical protein